MTGPVDPRRRTLRRVAGMATIALLVVACLAISGASSAPSAVAPRALPPRAAASSGSAQRPRRRAHGRLRRRSRPCPPSTPRARPPPAPRRDDDPFERARGGAGVVRQGDGRLLHRTRPGSRPRSRPRIHNDFQDQFNSYMQATPDDIVKWFTGERLRFPARNGLLTPIDDVWQTIGANYSDGMAKASQGDDGKKYAVPIVSYPWVINYRKSLFAGEGLHRPEDVGRVRHPGQEDPGRRPHPARLRRQGRLAGHGHVRRPEHAHERLPVPRRPPGRQAEVDRSQGPGRLREVGGAAALHPARPARPDLAGRRADVGQQQGGDVLPRHVRVPAGAGRRTWPTSTSSRSRPSGPSSTPSWASTPRSTRGS